MLGFKSSYAEYVEFNTELDLYLKSLGNEALWLKRFTVSLVATLAAGHRLCPISDADSDETLIRLSSMLDSNSGGQQPRTQSQGVPSSALVVSGTTDNPVYDLSKKITAYVLSKTDGQLHKLLEGIWEPVEAIATIKKAFKLRRRKEAKALFLETLDRVSALRLKRNKHSLAIFVQHNLKKFRQLDLSLLDACNALLGVEDIEDFPWLDESDSVDSYQSLFVPEYGENDVTYDADVSMEITGSSEGPENIENFSRALTEYQQEQCAAIAATPVSTTSAPVSSQPAPVSTPVTSTRAPVRQDTARAPINAPPPPVPASSAPAPAVAPSVAPSVPSSSASSAAPSVASSVAPSVASSASPAPPRPEPTATVDPRTRPASSVASNTAPAAPPAASSAAAPRAAPTTASTAAPVAAAPVAAPSATTNGASTNGTSQAAAPRAAAPPVTSSSSSTTASTTAPTSNATSSEVNFSISSSRSSTPALSSTPRSQDWIAQKAQALRASQNKQVEEYAFQIAGNGAGAEARTQELQSRITSLRASLHNKTALPQPTLQAPTPSLPPAISKTTNPPGTKELIAQIRANQLKLTQLGISIGRTKEPNALQKLRYDYRYLLETIQNAERYLRKVCNAGPYARRGKFATASSVSNKHPLPAAASSSPSRSTAVASSSAAPASNGHTSAPRPTTHQTQQPPAYSNGSSAENSRRATSTAPPSDNSIGMSIASQRRSDNEPGDESSTEYSIAGSRNSTEGPPSLIRSRDGSVDDGRSPKRHQTSHVDESRPGSSQDLITRYRAEDRGHEHDLVWGAPTSPSQDSGPPSRTSTQSPGAVAQRFQPRANHVPARVDAPAERWREEQEDLIYPPYDDRGQELASRLG